MDGGGGGGGVGGGVLSPFLCTHLIHTILQFSFIYFIFFFTKYQIKVALFLYLDYYFKEFIAFFCFVMALCSAASMVPRIRKIKMGASALHQLLANHPNLCSLDT